MFWDCVFGKIGRIGEAGKQEAHSRYSTTPAQRILTQKARLDRRHQFALVVLHDEGAALLQGFTSDTRTVLATAAHLEPVAPWRGAWVC